MLCSCSRSIRSVFSRFSAASVARLTASGEKSCGISRCPRLREHCTAIAATKRAAYRDDTYWGKPLPGFGDPAARLLVVGLAPGAHGANRTGRMFTGDRSGLFLMTAMHEAGFASIPRSESRRDGLVLRDAWITAESGRGSCPPGMRGLVRCLPEYEPPSRGDTMIRVLTIVATLVANVFQGAEVEILAGVSEEEAPHYEALEAVGALIARLET